MKQINKILTFVLVLGMSLSMGCASSAGPVEVTVRSVDVRYLYGSYQQIENVMSFRAAETGVFSHAYDVKILHDNNDVEIRRLHYVTSMDIISEDIITVWPSEDQYAIMKRPL